MDVKKAAAQCKATIWAAEQAAGVRKASGKRSNLSVPAGYMMDGGKLAKLRLPAAGVGSGGGAASSGTMSSGGGGGSNGAAGISRKDGGDLSRRGGNSSNTGGSMQGGRFHVARSCGRHCRLAFPEMAKAPRNTHISISGN